MKIRLTVLPRQQQKAKLGATSHSNQRWVAFVQQRCARREVRRWLPAAIAAATDLATTLARSAADLSMGDCLGTVAFFLWPAPASTPASTADGAGVEADPGELDLFADCDVEGCSAAGNVQ